MQVEIKEHVLTLTAERTRNSDIREEQNHRLERAYDAFQHSCLLPTEMDADAAAATRKDGLLKLTRPKAGETKLKEIEVKA